MAKDRHQRVLEEHLRAQLALMQACGRGAPPRGDAGPRLVRIDAFVQISRAMALTADAVASLRFAQPEYLPVLPPQLALPKLPQRPDEGEYPPPKICKTTSSGISNIVKRLRDNLSSPACGGGADPALDAGEAEGGPALLPLPSRRCAAIHLPRKRGRITRMKPKGGAPRGNRNALKSGNHTAAYRGFIKALRLYRVRLKASLVPLLTLPRRPMRVFYEVVRPERC